MHAVKSHGRAHAPFSVLLAVCAWILWGCGHDAPPSAFRVTFSALSDNTPLHGVEIAANGRTLGETGEDGLLRVDLQGREGMNVAYAVRCPEGHRDAETRPPLTLRKFEGLDPQAAERGIEISVSCPPSTRRVAVIVRTGGQAGIPVKMGGATVALTDASGVAHVLVESAPESEFRLTLDTNARTGLRPQNPMSVVTVPDSDAIAVFEIQFEVEVPGCPPGKRMRRGTCVNIRKKPTHNFHRPVRVIRPSGSR